MTVTIHILLATYQGAHHLREQLSSIEQQTYSRWYLWARDDGSTDATPSILLEFKQRHPHQVTLLQGQGEGASRNFFGLLQTIEPNSANDLIAFCDQDDVWLPDKLKHASQWHAKSSSPEAANLYCARTHVTDAQLHPLYLSPLPQHPLTLHNALVENVAGGNTMVMNIPLLHALRRISPEHAVLHDWCAYLAATACGGRTVFDEHPCLLYRQHGGNVIGARKGLAQRWARLGPLLRGSYRTWGDATESALQDLEPLLTPESRTLAAAFHAARHSATGAQRLRQAYRAGLVRQSRSAQLALWAALFLGLA
jgi:glycosyltransferase involved in cell wall biosynthesis